MDELKKLKLEMNSRGFSEKTKKSYLSFVEDFLNYSRKNSNKNLDKLTERNIKKYLSHLIEDKKYTNVTANLAISALKFFFQKVLNSNTCNKIERPKKEKKLPTVLSKKEIKKIINSTNNKKHELILKCLYGMGLRVSELVNLKVNDIYFQRNLVKIKGKGNKERYVKLPNDLKKGLKKYIEYKTPEKYLFPGRKGKYSIKSVQKIFEYASKKAGIEKKSKLPYFETLLCNAFIRTRNRY